MGEIATPRRIQLSRAKGWKMPENTVKVDRSTRYGNPYVVGLDLCAFDAVELFRRFVTGPAWDDPEIARTHQRLVEGLPALRGKNLACWCRPSWPCHADVLLEIANAPDPERQEVGS